MSEIEASTIRPLFGREEIAEICRQYEVKQLSLFGSYLHGTAGPESDIDLLVDFESPQSLITLISLQLALSEALGRKVDLLTPNSLSPYMRERVLSETEPVYVQG